MNYENLYQVLQLQEKNLKDSITALQRLSKTIGKETENGNMKSLSRNLKIMAEIASSVSSILEETQTVVDDFDTKAYFESGDFAEQMLAACKEKCIDVQGHFPVYEMFPYKIKLDAENQDVYMDRKKYSVCVLGVLRESLKPDRKSLIRLPSTLRPS